MIDNRIHQHPILLIEEKADIGFFWKNNLLNGKTGEPISSALIANGIHIFGHHPKDHSPQSIFCANGQCSQCLVVADGIPVKACITPLKSGMQIEPAEKLTNLPPINSTRSMKDIKEIEIPVLIIGGGPAGLSAALELAKANIQILVVDDKQILGGKLILQTHRFFGSAKTVYAGTRGIDIAKNLAIEASTFPQITVWSNSFALAVFSDKKVGILKDGNKYVLVKPDHLLIACGAREKSLSFSGNTLPGVLGAGAFQTLVNRDLVLPGKEIFIIGGGNVGLIAGYHALQAGIHISGLIEIMAECGGYKVHQDHLRRLGVPIFLSHKILGANGKNHVESVTIAQVNEDFQPIHNTEKSLTCDCVLIAVGLDPVNEFFKKAGEYGMSVYAAGDADEIAEASAAMISGKIRAIEIAHKINPKINSKIQSLDYQKTILSSKPGNVFEYKKFSNLTGLFPVFHCLQEIPCDPCSIICPFELIKLNEKDIRSLPSFIHSEKNCSGCLNCVAGCPGYAITLVDFRNNDDTAMVSIPFEFNQDLIRVGNLAFLMDIEGKELAIVPIEKIIQRKSFNSTKLVSFRVKKEIATRIAGYRIQNSIDIQNAFEQANLFEPDNIICRCERVKKSEILELIKAGYRDLNEIKTITRAGMGACGGKTCQNLILQLFKQEHIDLEKLTYQTNRPLFCEVSLNYFAGLNDLD